MCGNFVILFLGIYQNILFLRKYAVKLWGKGATNLFSHIQKLYIYDYGVVRVDRIIDNR